MALRKLATAYLCNIPCRAICVRFIRLYFNIRESALNWAEAIRVKIGVELRQVSLLCVNTLHREEIGEIRKVK